MSKKRVKARVFSPQPTPKKEEEEIHDYPQVAPAKKVFAVLPDDPDEHQSENSGQGADSPASNAAATPNDSDPSADDGSGGKPEDPIKAKKKEVLRQQAAQAKPFSFLPEKIDDAELDTDSKDAGKSYKVEKGSDDKSSVPNHDMQKDVRSSLPAFMQLKVSTPIQMKREESDSEAGMEFLETMADMAIQALDKVKTPDKPDDSKGKENQAAAEEGQRKKKEVQEKMKKGEAKDLVQEKPDRSKDKENNKNKKIATAPQDPNANADPHPSGPAAEEKDNDAGASGSESASQAAEVPAATKFTAGPSELPDPVRTRLEAVLNMSFNNVQIKANSDLPGNAGAVAAVAGNTMHFAPGHFDPNSAKGQRLIYHEAAHLRQQIDNGVPSMDGMINGIPVNLSPDLERQADYIAKGALEADVEQGRQILDQVANTTNPVAQMMTLDGFGGGYGDYSSYYALLDVIEGQKGQMNASIDGHIKTLDGKYEGVKGQIREAMDAEKNVYKENIDTAITAIRTATESARTTLTTHIETRTTDVSTSGDTEKAAIEAMVEAKKEQITTSSDGHAEAILNHGTTEGARAISSTQGLSQQMTSSVDSAYASYADREGADQLASEARSEASNISSQMVDSASQLNESLINDGTQMGEDIRSEATDIHGKFDEPRENANTEIDRKVEDTNEQINNSVEDFLNQLEQESQEVIQEFERQKGKLDKDYDALGRGAILGARTALRKAGKDIRRKTKDAGKQMDEIARAVAPIGWSSGDMTEAQADVAAAGAEYISELAGVMGGAANQFDHFAITVRQEATTFTRQIQSVLDEAVSAFETEIDAKVEEYKGNIDTTADEAITEIEGVKGNMEPKYDEAVTAADEAWGEGVEERSTDMTEKVDEAIEVQESAVSDFSSEVSSAFAKLPKHSPGLLESVGNFVMGGLEMLGGIVAGLFLGAVQMISDLAMLIVTPIMWVAAAIVIGIIAGLAAIVAGILGVTFGTAMLIIGIVIGVAMGVVLIVQAIMMDGSPYERGEKIGRGLFEIISSFVGTGIVARVGKWSARASRISGIIRQLGGLRKAIPILAYVDDVDGLLALANKVGDLGELSRIIDQVGDPAKVTQLINVLQNSDEAAGILAKMRGVGDLSLILNNLDNLPALGRAIDQLGLVKAQHLLDGRATLAQLDALISTGKIGPDTQVLNLLNNVGGDVDVLTKLLNQVDDAGQLNELMRLPGVRGASQLNNLLGQVPPNQLRSLLQHPMVQNGDQLDELIQIVGPQQLENLLNNPALENSDQLDNLVRNVDPQQWDNYLANGDQIDNTLPVVDDTVNNLDQTDNVVSNLDQTDNTASNLDQTDNAASNLDQTDNAASNLDQTDNTASNLNQTDNTVPPRTTGGAPTEQVPAEQLDNLRNSLNVEESGGVTRFLDDSGREVAYIDESGSLVYKYDGYGGDVTMDPDATTVALGRYTDPIDEGMGTSSIFKGSDEGAMWNGNDPTGGYTGRNNSIDMLNVDQSKLDAETVDLARSLGYDVNSLDDINGLPKEDQGRIWGQFTDQFWDTYNQPYLENAMENGDTFRFVSDPFAAANNQGSVFQREVDFLFDAANEPGSTYYYNRAGNAFEPRATAATTPPETLRALQNAGFTDPTQLDDMIKLAGNGDDLLALSQRIDDPARLENLLNNPKIRDAQQLEDLVTSVENPAQLDDLLANYNISDRNGNISFLDDSGNTFAYVDDNGSLTYAYKGYGGDVTMDPDATTVALGRYTDPIDEGMGTSSIFKGSDEGAMWNGNDPTGGYTGRNNSIDMLNVDQSKLDAETVDLARSLGYDVNSLDDINGLPKEDQGRIWGQFTDQFWDTYNQPYLENAMENGDTFRFVSDPFAAANNQGSVFQREVDFLFDQANAPGGKYYYNRSGNAFQPRATAAETPVEVMDALRGAGFEDTQLESLIPLAGSGDDLLTLSRRIDDPARLENLLNNPKIRDAQQLSELVEAVEPRHLDTLLADTGRIDDRSGMLRFLDDSGNEIAAVEEGSVVFRDGYDPNVPNTGATPVNPGGMLGSNVYDTAASKGKRVDKSINNSIKEINDQFNGNPENLIDGFEVAQDSGNVYKLTVDGSTEVNVTVRIERPTIYDALPSVHGSGNAGPAMNDLTYNPATGKWEATIYLKGNADVRDINKMVGHEFNEIGAIVRSESTNVAKPENAGNINQIIQNQQQASVFKQGGATDAAAMTAHDHAFVKEMSVLAEEITVLRNGPGKDADKLRLTQLEQSLNRLMTVAGIQEMGDPRMAVFLSEANLTPATRRSLTNLGFSNLVAIANGGSTSLTPKVIGHLRFPELKNTTVASFTSMGVSGGHVTSDLLALSTAHIDSATGNPIYKFVHQGTSNISVGDATSAIHKYDQLMWDPATAAYVTSGVQKTTFDDEAAMVAILGNFFETTVKPTLPASADNHRFQLPLAGVMVEGFVGINPSATPPFDIRSIYIMSNSF